MSSIATPSQLFSTPLEKSDPEVAALIVAEHRRQSDQIELIASENIVSRAVLDAQGSVLTNKYAEGYPGRRYYGGCEEVDKAENLAIERAKRLFGCAFVNVQPHSGSQANQGVYMATMQPGDTLMGPGLAAGGHLTHGSPVNQSGKWFKVAAYGVRPEDHTNDMDEVERLAHEHHPKIIIAGATSYPRILDYARFRAIADSVGALLMVDMAHFSGLVAGGVYPSPFPYADIVTTTTHKTLRGPRGGMIMTNHEDLAKKINSAIFPGIQGGPLMHVIAAKAVMLGEALQPEFKDYAQRIIDNAKALADSLLQRGYDLMTGGTDCHLIVMDLRAKGLVGKDAQETLDRAGLTVNKNAVPFDPLPPTKASGIRIGTPAGTTRGFGTDEFRHIGNWIADILDAMTRSNSGEIEATERAIRSQTRDLCRRFPIYPK
ncbi:MAG: serine hydroxymethyltransferase [Alphaproteobacteria bacterium]|nr:MAG: serine hydroxymethyltransferase [Alphaproteobacteria bacterium]